MRTVRSRARALLLCVGSCLAFLCPNLAVKGAEPTNSVDAVDRKYFSSLSLDELGSIKVGTVVGASKHEQKVTDAPAAVSIITRQDIQEYGYRTLGDLLNGVRGLYTTFDRGYHFLGMRGVNRLGDFGGRTLLNINGHRINEPIYDSSFMGYDFPMDVDLIERVEVIRGPGSSLYGNNAFLGVINVVTREGHSFSGRGMEASGSAGEWGTYQGRFSYGSKFTNGIELTLSGTYYESAGNPRLEFPSSAANGFPGAVERNHDGESSRNFFGSLSYNGLTLETVYGRRDKELPNGPYSAIFNDGRNRLWDERSYVEARYVKDLPDDWHVQARTYFDHYTYEGTFIYDYGDPLYTGLSDNRDTPVAQWWGGELQLSKVLAEKHHVTFGVEGRHDFKQHQQNYDATPPFTYINATKSMFSVGAYAQDEYEILRTLKLDAGLRYDYFSTFGDTVNPRGGLIYQPVESSTFKALYGQAYRAPNAYEFDFDNATYVSNPALKPETVRSYELVWEQGIAKNYRITSSVFYDQIDGLITQGVSSNPADPRIIFNNADSVDLRGGEFEVEARWSHGLRARSSYTFVEAVNKVTHQILDNSPRHIGKAQITIPIYPEKVFAGLELLAMSSRGTVQGNQVPGQVLVNLTLFSRELIRNLDLSASVYNLLDRRYYDPGSPDFAQERTPQDGRTFRVKLTYRF